jgi:pilus assembly protein CpaE
MMTDTRPYIVGHDLTDDQLAAIEGLGIDIKVNGNAAPKPRECRVIVVFSPKGGSGKTVVASNLAAALAQRHPGRVVAVDLDVQFGDLATALAVQPEHTLAQLTGASTFDATTVKLFLTPFDGMFLLAGTNSPEEADLINHSHVTAVLPLLAQNFDYVIVDTPAGLDERTLAALECATDLLLVSSLDVPSIRNLRKALDTLDKIGVKADRQFILNKADDKVGLGLKDAEEAIGMKVTGEIPSTRDIPLSVNVGVPIVLNEPRSAAAKQLQLVSQLYAPVEVDKPKRGWRR